MRVKVRYKKLERRAMMVDFVKPEGFTRMISASL